MSFSAESRLRISNWRNWACRRHWRIVSLRPDVLTTLVKKCRRIKVVRLCASWAEELNLPWATAVKTAAEKQLGHDRWTHRLKDGTFLVLKA